MKTKARQRHTTSQICWGSNPLETLGQIRTTEETKSVVGKLKKKKVVP